ncbi:3-methyl-2-oxobutanoate hydroxymethyltransferase [Halonatronum saccharophilum]|uniref:3-methyl-2-oxobutanoate hydroxymethyltransferase n=1 Tax=Halonatronum saccharophilum TaxID=150060 RepID=UPI000481A7DB|nr:3-methyl-2-oxobutanoate hydroxymethyltransferase [Halonatronum saccharophilum]
MKKVSVSTLANKKEAGKKISMLTAYDYPTAKLIDQAEIDIALVGDSLGMVLLGYENTLKVTLDDILHHTKAVARGLKKAFLVADMPFASYKMGDIKETVKGAARLVQLGGAEGVKLEGGREIIDEVRAIIKAGIPVMGHLGLTPQSVKHFGGFKVQAKEEEAAKTLLEDAKILEEAGVFSLVLECIPAPLAKKVSQSLSIPVIGIGAGKGCDGQVLVNQDLLGVSNDFKPRFVRRYANLNEEMLDAFKRYREDVEQGNFPNEEESFL